MATGRLFKRLAHFDLHDRRNKFTPERQDHAAALESIFAEATSLGYSRADFHDSIALEIEVYESDRSEAMNGGSGSAYIRQSVSA